MLIYKDNMITKQGASGHIYVQKILDGQIPLLGLDVNGDKIRIRTDKTPASASDTGTAGWICWDANYLYVCVDTNTWKKIGISTW